MRASDILGRLGGEEFVAILPASSDDSGGGGGTRPALAFETPGVMVADQPVGATVSIGVASGEPGADVMALIDGGRQGALQGQGERPQPGRAVGGAASVPRDERLDALPAVSGRRRSRRTGDDLRSSSAHRDSVQEFQIESG